MENKLLQIIEAALLSASRPLSIEEILKIFPEDEAPTKENIKSALDITYKICSKIHWKGYFYRKDIGS